jgi:nucleoside-triphosphatase THEP1
LPEKAVAVVSFMAPLEFPVADEIKRHPGVETLLVTRDNRAEVMGKVLNWLAEEIN